MPTTRHSLDQRYQITRCIRESAPVMVLLCLLALLTPALTNAQSTEPRMTPVTERLYQFSSDEAAGAFFVGDRGVVVIDPMNDEIAQWLSNAIESQFDQPVTHVIYSSHLPQRSGGAAVFDSAIVIAHEQLLNATDDSVRVPPSVVFSDTLTLLPGEQTVTLLSVGSGFTETALAVYFPTEDAMYAGDLVAIESLPGLPSEALQSANVAQWPAAIDRMNRIDFTFLLTSHPGVGIQNDARQHGHFVRELVYRVQRGIADAQSVQSLQDSITMENYRRWRRFDSLGQLISDVATALQ